MAMLWWAIFWMVVFTCSFGVCLISRIKTLEKSAKGYTDFYTPSYKINTTVEKLEKEDKTLRQQIKELSRDFDILLEYLEIDISPITTVRRAIPRKEVVEDVYEPFESPHKVP